MGSYVQLRVRGKRENSAALEKIVKQLLDVLDFGEQSRASPNKKLKSIF